MNLSAVDPINVFALPLPILNSFDLIERWPKQKPISLVSWTLIGWNPIKRNLRNRLLVKTIQF